MTQQERRIFLIKYLLNEDKQSDDIAIPDSDEAQQILLRSLLNVRVPQKASEEFIAIQNEYLQIRNAQRGITDFDNLKPLSQAPIDNQIYLWRGDITTLKIDAIVNAANSSLTGCWQPCHNCIDNCIHTFAGVQLRHVCYDIMQEQGFAEPTGKAKITEAFNLPCKYVIHTVGPIINGRLTADDRNLLSECYKSCLNISLQNNINSIAFCCISTGVFAFPQDKAAEIAVKTVKNWLTDTDSHIKVVFNVFSEKDEQIYKNILGELRL